MAIRTLALASDHAGVAMKSALIERLGAAGYEARDFGPQDGSAVDYPDYAAKVAEAVRDGEVDAGILMCGTGIGMCIAANKVRGVRAALIHDPFTAEKAREHNDANVVTFGARMLSEAYAWLCVKTWLDTGYEPEPRHVRRLGKISRLEGGPGALDGAE